MTSELLSVKDYKQNYKGRIEAEDVLYPEGEVLTEDLDTNPHDDTLESKPSKQATPGKPFEYVFDKKAAKTDSNEQAGGWLANSGLSEDQQMKLFRLMGGKSKEDMELLNQRNATYNYDRVTFEAEDEFKQGIKKRMGSKLKGLGKR